MSTWEHCLTHGDQETRSFIREYFGDADRRTLIVGGAGFDPRSTVVSETIAEVAKQNLRGIFVREERPKPATDLIRRAEANVTSLKTLVARSSFHSVDIFDASDAAVVGAKRLIWLLAPLIREEPSVTDIALDLSALSIGISFPLVRYVYEEFGTHKGAPNIHLFVAEDVSLDSQVRPEHADQAMYIPGFGGDAALDQTQQATRLWIPQLVRGRKEALHRIHDFVKAEETCPILPFPATDLRRGDMLLEHYMAEITDAWEVDPRAYIYAAEREPIDLYRTLIRLDDTRKRVYAEHGGSLLVLSPVGSKVLAIGALLAALERNFPVAYLESLSYTLPTDGVAVRPSWPIVHVWLSGDAYA
jgi:hypothetical protein